MICNRSAVARLFRGEDFRAASAQIIRVRGLPIEFSFLGGAIS